MERAKGVEPSTFSLATRRSTTELCPHLKLLLKIEAFRKLSKLLFLLNLSPTESNEVTKTNKYLWFKFYI